MADNGRGKEVIKEAVSTEEGVKIAEGRRVGCDNEEEFVGEGEDSARCCVRDQRVAEWLNQ